MLGFNVGCSFAGSLSDLTVGAHGLDATVNACDTTSTLIGSVTPFVRLEKTALNPLENYFLCQASGRSYQRTALGLHCAVDPAPAVKGSNAEVIAFVKATPGTVGCVGGASSGVKVLQKY